MSESGIRQAEFTVVSFTLFSEDQAIRMYELSHRRGLYAELADTLSFGISQPLSHEHRIIIITVFQHPAGDRRWRMFPIRKNADLGRAFDQGTIELVPRPPGKGDDPHIVIGHQ